MIKALGLVGKFKVGPVTDKGLYDQAKGFSDSISKGSVKAKHGEEKPKDQASII